jgi:hypothetical protein
MHFPVKLTLPGLPAWLGGRLRIALAGNPRHLLDTAGAGGVNGAPPADPEAFARMVATLSSGTTSKTTHRARHAASDALIDELVGAGEPVVLDVGVSDGTTALDLLDRLGRRFRQYFATDVAFEVPAVERGGNVYFYDDHGACTLVATKHAIVYANVAGAVFPFGPLARALVSAAPPADRARRVSLVNPELARRAARDARVVVREFDVFAPWDGPPPDLVKVANVLNRGAFPDARIRVALANLKAALAPGGTLVVTDNRAREKASAFTKRGDRFERGRELGGGCEITDLVLQA